MKQECKESIEKLERAHQEELQGLQAAAKAEKDAVSALCEHLSARAEKAEAAFQERQRACEDRVSEARRVTQEARKKAEAAHQARLEFEARLKTPTTGFYSMKWLLAQKDTVVRAFVGLPLLGLQLLLDLFTTCELQSTIGTVKGDKRT